MGDNVVQDLLQGIRDELRGLRSEPREQQVMIIAIERSMAHVEAEQAVFRAEWNIRFDRVLDRLDRIERRLEIAPTH
jgi:hypothetical protein